MDHPLVTIICLCYNQAAFVATAIDSVLQQSYQNIELIIVDDASSDESQSVIAALANDQSPKIKTIFRTSNGGNCVAFNSGLSISRGKYIIDLAADDILMKERVAEGVRVLEALPEGYGIHYCDVIEIDPSGVEQLSKKTTKKPKYLEGDLYQLLITSYWINPASMLIKKSVLDDLSGYDESLSYEDFDFWIRSARNYLYAYSSQALVKKRVVIDSLGSQQNKYRNKHEYSTFSVCQKIQQLNRTKEENHALKRRIIYEIKRCLKLGHFGLAIRYFKMLITN